MLRYLQGIALATLALATLQAQASLLNKLASDQSDRLQLRNLGANQEEQLHQQYLSSDERMPERCNPVCEKFTKLTADCRVKNGTAWQQCVCTTENFDAWNTCASCAPTYYDIYTGGFAAFFRNALSECDSVGLKVNLTTKVPGSDTFSNVNTGNGSLSGLNKTSGTSSTYKINTIAILAISGPLASVLLL